LCLDSCKSILGSTEHADVGPGEMAQRQLFEQRSRVAVVFVVCVTRVRHQPHVLDLKLCIWFHDGVVQAKDALQRYINLVHLGPLKPPLTMP
jgi:hypothetical protein